MGEQVEEEMKISLSIRIKPLNLDEMDSDELRSKANQIWNTIVVLETDKYDYEQRQLDQDYEFKELKERQKLQLRNKAIKKGLDPESFTGAHPPTIHMFSKYERRTDTRTYGDRKKLYEGGAEVIRAEMLEASWKEKFAEWSKRPKARLPKWFGERPGKKAGDPETPEGEEDAGAEAEEAEEDYDEEGKKKRNKKFLTDMWQTSTSYRRNYKHSIRVIASIPSRALVSWFSPFCCYCYRHDQTGQ